jgi:hypothetical protein
MKANGPHTFNWCIALIEADREPCLVLIIVFSGTDPIPILAPDGIEGSAFGFRTANNPKQYP